MACNINRLKTRRDEGRACSPCDDAYRQTRVFARCPHTQSLGPLISVFIFDIKLHGGAIMATMSLPEEEGHNGTEIFKKGPYNCCLGPSC